MVLAILLTDFFRDEAGLPLYLHLFTVMRLSHFAIFVAILCLVSGEASAIQEMRPPFGMTWGESQKNVEKILLGTKVKIVGLKTLQGRTAIEVEGIRQQHLLKALFYFDSDALSEIELQYGCAEWDSARSNDFWDGAKNNIDSKYGDGRLVANEKTRENDIKQSLTGYQWTQAYMCLRLFLYTAEKDSDFLQRVSLHYKQM